MERDTKQVGGWRCEKERECYHHTCGKRARREDMTVLLMLLPWTCASTASSMSSSEAVMVAHMDCEPRVKEEGEAGNGRN